MPPKSAARPARGPELAADRCRPGGCDPDPGDRLDGGVRHRRRFERDRGPDCAIGAAGRRLAGRRRPSNCRRRRSGEPAAKARSPSYPASQSGGSAFAGGGPGAGQPHRQPSKRSSSRTSETLNALRQRSESAAAANAAALNDINQRLARQDPPAGAIGRDRAGRGRQRGHHRGLGKSPRRSRGRRQDDRDGARRRGCQTRRREHRRPCRAHRRYRGCAHGCGRARPPVRGRAQGGAIARSRSGRACAARSFRLDRRAERQCAGARAHQPGAGAAAGRRRAGPPKAASWRSCRPMRSGWCASGRSRRFRATIPPR